MTVSDMLRLSGPHPRKWTRVEDYVVMGYTKLTRSPFVLPYINDTKNPLDFAARHARHRGYNRKN